MSAPVTVVVTTVELEREWTCFSCWAGPDEMLSSRCTCSSGPVALDVRGCVWTENGEEQVLVTSVRDEARHRVWPCGSIQDEFSEADRVRFQEAVWHQFLKDEAKGNSAPNAEAVL